MAPEQARGEPLDLRADLFALGVVLYEALAGRHLFRSLDGNEVETLYRVLYEDLPTLRDAWPEAPRELEELYRRAIERDRAARFASSLAFAQALEQAAPRVGGLAPRDALAALVTREFADKIAERQARLAGMALRSVAPPRPSRASATAPAASHTASFVALPPSPPSPTRAIVIGVAAGVMLCGLVVTTTLLAPRTPTSTPGAVLTSPLSPDGPPGLASSVLPMPALPPSNGPITSTPADSSAEALPAEPPAPSASAAQQSSSKGPTRPKPPLPAQPPPDPLFDNPYRKP
jgi:hypothetical protein